MKLSAHFLNLTEKTYSNRCYALLGVGWPSEFSPLEI